MLAIKANEKWYANAIAMCTQTPYHPCISAPLEAPPVKSLDTPLSLT